MTEKEKILAGKPFIWDEKKRKDFYFTQELLFDLNILRPSEIDKKKEIIKKFFGNRGCNFKIRSPFYCSFGYNIFVGENFYANCYCHIMDSAKVTIGNNVMFGPNVHLLGVGHHVHYDFRKFIIALPITIGNKVWIGGGTIINPGVSIADNTVIGSGSIVIKDIPANVIAAGNPCRVIREITEDDRQYCYKGLKFEVEE
jgi:acetyltransferase-like isoleucine patch superfamily enzyme